MNSTGYRAAFAAFIAATITATSLAVWPPAVAHAQEGEACSLPPSAHAQGGEWLSCLRVGTELDTLPAAGEEATIRFDVTAQYSRSNLTVEAQLPSNLDWIRLPEGFQSRDSHLATGAISLGGNETRRFEGLVRATEPGGAQISVRLLAPPQIDPEDGSISSQEAAVDSQFLTIAGAGGRSTPGLDVRPDGPAAVAQNPSEPGLVTPELEHRAVPETQQQAIMAPGDTSCVSGSFGYLEGVVNRLAPNITVEVWDTDFFSTNDLLATGLTDGVGAYNICFPSDDDDGPFFDFAQDVSVVFSAVNSRWRVQELGTAKLFAWSSPVISNLPAFATHNFGYLQPGPPAQHPAVQAFDTVNDFWKWVPGSCWDANDAAASCKQMIINWRADSMVGPHYDPNNKQVFLNFDAPLFRDVTVHEATHAVMDDVYEGTPIPGAGGAHSIHLASNVGLSWVEGFAEWTPVAVYQSPIFTTSLGSVNLETIKWGTPQWHNGDTVEGRVAGALIDISDATNETPWDRLSEGNGPGNIWKTFLGSAIGPPRVQKSFKDFWTHRTQDGFNVAATGGLSTIYQNTIDYSFRDPIANYSPQLRPQPFVPHNFSFNTTTPYWSVFATRPTAGVDHDLRLYEDFTQTTLLSTSNLGASTVDFIAVDSNKKAFTDYYPRISAAVGSGNCRLELAQGQGSLAANSSQAVSMGTGADVVEVRDTFLTANTTVTIKVIPTVANQNPELFLMRSLTGQPTTFVRSRAQAFKASTAAGPGATESFTFVVPTSDWYGIVIINLAGAGNLTLQRIG